MILNGVYYNDFLYFFKILEALLFSLVLFHVYKDYNQSKHSVIFAIKMVILVNFCFILYQYISGDFIGVERAVERRAGVFYEPAIGVSGFFIAYITLLSALLRLKIYSLLSFASLLGTTSFGAIFSFLFISMLYLVGNNHRRIKLFIVWAIFVLLLYFVVATFYYDFPLYRNLIKRSEQLLIVATTFDISVLGVRGYNWSYLIDSFDIPLLNIFGYNEIRTIDNYYLKTLYSNGLFSLLILVLMFFALYIKSSWPGRLFILMIAFQSLSHDILTPIKVVEMIPFVFMFNYVYFYGIKDCKKYGSALNRVGNPLACGRTLNPRFI